jgi:hypothetical protein
MIDLHFITRSAILMDIHGQEFIINSGFIYPPDNKKHTFVSLSEQESYGRNWYKKYHGCDDDAFSCYGAS